MTPSLETFALNIILCLKLLSLDKRPLQKMTHFLLLIAIPDNENYHAESSMPIVDTSDLAERSFFMTTPDDRQRVRANIVKALDSRQDYLKSNPTM